MAKKGNVFGLLSEVSSDFEPSDQVGLPQSSQLILEITAIPHGTISEKLEKS